MTALPEELKFGFGKTGLRILEQTKLTHETLGYACRVEVEKVGEHNIHWLICLPPKKPSRAERGCLI